MENKQLEPEMNLSTDSSMSDIPLLYDYPESKSQINMGGSTQVLGDFFEFTDYLIPHNRVFPMQRCTRLSHEDDQYTGFLYT